MPISRRITKFNRRVVNPVTLRLLGLASLVELEHVGRRSGRDYRTPVMAFRRGDVVTIALTYGPQVDWLRNVEAAGGCLMRTRSGVTRLGPPRRVGAEQALAAIPHPQRSLLRWPVRCEDYVQLPVEN